MNRESHSLRSLQDFVRIVSIPPTLKRGNSRSQTGESGLDLNAKYALMD